MPHFCGGAMAILASDKEACRACGPNASAKTAKRLAVEVRKRYSAGRYKADFWIPRPK